MNDPGQRPRASVRAADIRTIVPIALLVLGAAFRLDLFLANHSLSIDEAALARNLIERPWSRLTGPLDYAQVAPLGFLFAQKGLLTTFGSAERSMRALPLTCGVAALWLCWVVSRRIMSRPLAACVLALCAMSRPLIEYSAIAKQYSLDVVITLLIAWITIEAIDRPTTLTRAWLLGVAGTVTTLFSFTSAFGLAAATVTGVVMALRERGQKPMVLRLLPSALWLMGAAGGPLAARLEVDPLDAQYLRFFWSAGFMPIGPAVAAATWSWRGLENLVSQTGAYRAAAGWLFLMLVGLGSLYRRRRPDLLLVLAAPLGFVLLASAARLYPFTHGRLQLFLLPLALILAVEGSASFLRLGLPRPVRAVPIVTLMALGVFAAATTRDRATAEEIKPFLRHAKASWRSGDRLWVYYPLGQAFLYYAPRFGFTPDDYAIATCSAGSARRYLRELDAQLQGSSRTWVLMPHNQAGEIEVIFSYLNAVATLDSRHPANIDTGIDGTRIGYVADVRDRAAGGPRADDFAVPADMDRAEPYPWMCHGVMQPLRGTARL